MNPLLHVALLLPCCTEAASGPQEPARAPLPDPVAFVDALLKELDPHSIRIWERQLALWKDTGADDPGSGGLQADWSDPAIAREWAGIETALRPHFEAPAFTAYFPERGPQRERENWWLCLAMPERFTFEMKRTLSLASADLEAPTPAAAVLLGIEVLPLDLGGESVLHLYAQEGTWRIQGFGHLREPAQPAPPICARAAPMWNDGQLWDDLFVRLEPAADPGAAPRSVPSFSFDAPAQDPGFEDAPHGAERLVRELAVDPPPWIRRKLEKDGQAALRVQAPAAVALRDLQPLVAFAALQAPRAIRYLFLVDLDRTQRPGVLRFDQGAAGSAHPCVAAGSDPQTWPAALREGPPPAVAGIEMLPDATVADLAATADALLARGVGTLFLSAPLWDPQGPDDPVRRARAEAYWKIAESMRDALAPADDPR